MKKIYMPSEQKLHEMQALGANVYKYLLIKAVESLIVDGINYPHKGILKSAYKYLRENPDIAHAICLLYPEEIKYSFVAMYDAELCEQLIGKQQDTSIYSLDNLSHFPNSISYNLSVVDTTIDKLDEYLPRTPQYRFEYQSNELLEDIFSTKILQQVNFRSPETMAQLTRIEPAYAVLFPEASPIMSFSESQINDAYRKEILIEGINAYAKRYQIASIISGSNQHNEDILTNPDENVKKLLKCIRENKSNLY